MANVTGYVPLIPDVDPEDYYKYPHELQEKAMDKLLATGRVIRFPRGDGYAFYFVPVSRKNELWFIPYGDQWEEDEIILRALRKKDIEELMIRERKIKELFNGNPNP